MSTLWNGTGEESRSMAVASDGSYGVPSGLMYSFPCHTKGGDWEIVKNVEHSEDSAQRIAASADELASERAAVAALLG